MEIEQPLLLKIDLFIRKYYKIRLLQGALFLVATTMALFLLLVIPEYFLYLGRGFRTILFFSYLLVFLFLFVKFILITGLKLIRIGPLISREEAAEIIGKHFPEIDDRLLNTLDLLGQQRNSDVNQALLRAGIDQRITMLSPIQFNYAISFKSGLKYLRYALPPTLLFLLLVVVSPGIISEPAQRFIHYNERFTKPLPFRYTILNKNLTAMQQEDFELLLKFSGDEIPSEVFLLSGGITYSMRRVDPVNFAYKFRMLQSDVVFRIVAGPAESEEFTLHVFPRPIILNLSVALAYPSYTGKGTETVENMGDLIVPEGTRVEWKITTRDVSELSMAFPKQVVKVEKSGENSYSYVRTVTEGFNYSIRPSNAFSYRDDTLAYKINVVKDAFPSIVAVESADSAFVDNLFFKGTIKDDYGFTKMLFLCEIIDPSDTTLKRTFSEPVSLDLTSNSQLFYYSFDLSSKLTFPGQRIKYCLEVWDNDGIHGPKPARTPMRLIQTPSLEEIIEKENQRAEEVKQKMESSLKTTQSVKKSLDELKRKMVDQSGLSWKEKKQVEEMLESNEKIIENIEQVKKMNKENLLREERLNERSESLREKQDLLNKMMDQMFTEEMKKMMQEMKDLLNKMDKNKLQGLMEKMKVTNKELEKQLDQNIALYKQLDFQRKLEDKVSEIRKTAEKLEKLSEKTKEGKEQDELVQKEHEKIEDDFDSIRKELEELKEEGMSLETPIDLKPSEKLQDSIAGALNEAKASLSKGKKKEASGKQKQGAEQMEKLANNLESSQEGSEDEQMEEDADQVRQLLENLLRLSFGQENLMQEARVINRSDPRYPSLIAEQGGIKEKMKGIEDSLAKIARRQVFIQPIIGKEVAAVNKNIAGSMEMLDLRNTGQALTRMQYAMTAINNLANLLSESLDRMNEQMKSSMMSKSGTKSCSKPSSKGGKKSVKDMKELQQKLSDQLKQMKEGMKQPGKEGKGSKEENSAMNRQLARMAAQQEALRNELQKYQQQLMEEGNKDVGNINKAINEMEETEKDILNKRINAETINRQQRIVTRLLESEKAEQQRDMEEKRESNEAKSQKYSNQSEIFKYNQKIGASKEMLRFTELPVNSYYRLRVNNYLLKLSY